MISLAIREDVLFYILEIFKSNSFDDKVKNNN